MAYDHKEIEAKWQSFWETEKLFHFDFDTKKPIYSIDNPPRYANAALHLGHATSYTHIDFVARYKRLRGFEVYFPLCADVNGMPIEKSVEKKFGVDKHNTDRQTLIKMCREFANKNIAEMTRQFKILGHTMDPSIYYQTDAPYYRRMTQISFIRLFKKGRIYRSTQPITWCPSCGTALASAEVEYEDRKTKLNYIKFKDEEGNPVVIATTRPEMLSVCKMVAVNPDDERHQRLIGKNLMTPLYNKAVRVVDDENVLKDFGTGIVMICTIGDKDDLEWIRRYDILVENAIDEHGKLTGVTGKYKGMPIADARKAVLEDLKAQDLLVKQEDLDQSVGACWRCHSAVEFLNVKQWFLKILDLKDKVHELNDQLHWHPEFMKERLSNWTDSLGWDWCISRQRYFATAIPLWLCQKKDCDGVVLADEKQTYVDPTITEPPVKTCPKCGGPLKGCEDVFDTWMDSSLSALYNSHWERDEKRFKMLFPMSLRPQSHDIIRTWAFYTMVRSFQLTEQLPWKDIVISGFIMAPDGRPMHTSLGNVVDPLPLLDKYGADGMRFFAGTCSLGKDQPFQEKEVVHGRRLAEKVYNIGRFIGNLLKEYKISNRVEPAPLDKWLLTRYSRTVTEVTCALDEYCFDRATRALENFIWHEFADHYLELVKHRVYGKKDPAALQTLYEVGQGLLTMLSFLQPHITEEVYQTQFKHLTGVSSIGLTPWPTAPPVDEDNERKGELVKEITAALRSHKAEKKMALNAPLPKVQIVSELDLTGMLSDIKGATNAAEVVMSERGDLKEIPGEVKPVKSKIGPQFKGKAGAIVEALKKEDPAKLAKAFEKGPIKLKIAGGEEFTIGPEHAEVIPKWTIKGKDVDLIHVKDITVLVERASQDPQKI